MWNTITIQSNLIQGETPRAYLIKFPKTEWKVWIPSKLVRFKGKNNYLAVVSYKEDMNYNIFKNGKGRYNNMDKIAEKTIDINTFKEMFGVTSDED